MPDPLIIERLELKLVHARKIQLRLQNTDDASYFISYEAGEQLYDSLITRLRAMGENFKKIDQLDRRFIIDSLNLDIPPIVPSRNTKSDFGY